jgi:hypothetical protein
MKLSFDRSRAVIGSVDRPGVKRVEASVEPWSGEQLLRSAQRLRVDCELIMKAQHRQYAEGRIAVDGPMIAVDHRIRDWLGTQLKADGRFSHVMMEQPRSTKNPAGTITLETKDGLRVSVREPMPYGYYCYLATDIQQTRAKCLYLDQENADRLQRETKMLSDLSSVLKTTWSISTAPHTGCSPLLIDPRAFAACGLQIQNNALSFAYPEKGIQVSKNPSPLSLGNPLITLDSAEIMERLRGAPTIPVPMKREEAA